MAGWDDKGLGKFIKENRRVVQVSGLNAKTGFTFEDAHLMDIKQKIEAAGKPLGEYGTARIGIKTGLNDLFIIDEQQYTSFMAKCNSTEKMCIHRMIKGETIGTGKNMYVIHIPYNWTDSIVGKSSPEDKLRENMPSIQEYLEATAKYLFGQGKNPYDRPSRGKYWWELIAYTGINDLAKDKLAWADIANKNKFAYADENTWVEKTCYCMQLSRETAEVISKLMNTSICDNIVKRWYVVSNFGKNSVNYGSAIKNMPIPYGISTEILNKNGDELERYIQQLYNLTDEDAEYLLKQ